MTTCTVLGVGISSFAREQIVASIHNGFVRRGRTWNTSELRIAENCEEAVSLARSHQLDVVHFCNQTGIKPLRYSHKCEQLAALFELYHEPPLLCSMDYPLLQRLTPTFVRHNMLIRHCDLSDGIYQSYIRRRQKTA
ncbi:MAG: hypothetical protein P4L81_03080 [Candidatus Pacebacteria bacterium]|nr:hypothetical protein [Candidatus Paceibacterota bacterium]